MQAVSYTHLDVYKRQVEEDIAEGADLIIAKPAMAYMDIITEIRRNYNIPIVAYNVSGEYQLHVIILL